MRTIAAAAAAALATALGAAFAPAAHAAPPLPPVDAIAPGVGVAVMNASGAADATCSVGFIVQNAAGQLGTLSAGHCDHGGGFMTNYAGTDSWENIGSFSRAVHEGSVGEDADFGFVALTNSGVTVDDDIIGVRPVNGVTSDVVVGDELCKFGVRTQRTCGRVTSATATKVVFNADVERGDSGGPVYRLNADGTASAVGIVVRESDMGGTVAELAEPWMKEWNLTLVDSDAPGQTTVKPIGYPR